MEKYMTQHVTILFRLDQDHTANQSPFLSKPQLNFNLTTIQPKLGLIRKWLCTPPHPTHTNSMSVIFQLLLTRFWPNFKRRFLGLSWTDFNCSSNICWGIICPGNICPGNICPYQEYLSCYWPDFDETLKVSSWDYIELILTVAATFVHATFVLATFVHIRNISAVTDPILMKL